MGRKRWLIPAVVVTFLVAMMVGPSQTHAVRLAAEACDADRFLLQVLRSGMVLVLPRRARSAGKRPPSGSRPRWDRPAGFSAPAACRPPSWAGGVLGKERK